MTVQFKKRLRHAVAIGAAVLWVGGAGAGMAHALAATPSSVHYQASILVGSQRFTGISYAVYQKSTYMNERQLAHVLNTFGLGAEVTGDSLTTLWLGQFHAGAALHLGNQTIARAGEFSLRGNVYANVSTIAAHLQWRMSYDGTTGTLAMHQSLNSHNRFVSSRTLADVSRSPVGSTATSATSTWGQFADLAAKVVKLEGVPYVSVWSVVHVLNSLGYSAAYQHGMLHVEALPSIVQDGALDSRGNSAITTLMRYQGQWFAPLSSVIGGLNLASSVNSNGQTYVAAFPALHSPKSDGGATGSFSVWVQGSVSDSTTTAVSQPCVAAFLQQDGSVVTASLPSNGDSVQVTLTGSQAVFMGYESPIQGWVGAASPVTPQTSTVSLPQTAVQGQIDGRIVGAGNSGGTVVIRNVATHADQTFRFQPGGRYAATLPYGVYEVWTVDQKGISEFVGSRFVVNAPSQRVGSVAWSQMSTNGLVVSSHGVVMAQNADVPAPALLNISRIFERAYAADKQLLGLRVARPITIQVFGSDAEFTQHFLDESYGSDVSGTYGQDTQAVTEGPQSIALNIASLSVDDEVNVLAHELTHALLAEQDFNVPTWFNEGLAWFAGMAAQVGESPLELLSQSLQDDLWESPLEAAKAGTLDPLLTASSVAPGYNVEAQDNFAVEQLVQSKGLDSVLQFAKQVSSGREAAVFQTVFGESEDAFASRINVALTSEAQQHPMDLQVRLYAGATESTDIFVSNPQGKTYLYSGVTPNTGYAFTLLSNGGVKAPSGITLIGVSQSPSDGHWDVGMDNGSTQSFFSLSNQFGQAYLVTTNTFVGSSNEPILSDATVLPLHLQLVSIATTGSGSGS